MPTCWRPASGPSSTWGPDRSTGGARGPAGGSAVMTNLPSTGIPVTPHPRRILVTGATGYVGGRLVPRLLAAGYQVRCLTRDPERLAGRPAPWSQATRVRGD